MNGDRGSNQLFLVYASLLAMATASGERKSSFRGRQRRSPKLMTVGYDQLYVTVSAYQIIQRYSLAIPHIISV